MVVMVVPITQYSPHLPISCLFVHLLLEIIFLMYWAELSSGSHVVTVSFFFYSWQSFFFQSNPNIYWRSVILPFSFLWVCVTLCCVPLILFFVCALFPYISFLPCCPKWALHFSFLNISFIDNALVYFSPPNRRYNTNLYLGVSVVFSLKPTFLFLPLITYHLFSETAD